MKKALIALTIASALTGLTACTSQQSSSTTQPAAAEQVAAEGFAAFSEQFIEGLWQQSPTWALYSGYHKYDGILQVPNDTARSAYLAFVKAELNKLQSFDKAQLSPNELIDYRLIENLLQRGAWEIEVFKSWQWNPSSYNVSGGFAQIINEDFAPLDDRLRSFLARMENVPAYYLAAQANISKPTLEHTQLAVMQNKGAFSVFSDELLEKCQDQA